MGIEAVFICSAEGKLLYSRNYSTSLSQFLIEDFAFGLQAAFLKNNQHIFVAHGAYRLVYLPIESCLLVLVTDAASNIIEDVESVGRIKEVVAGLTDKRLTEETIFENYIDLTMAFDEMINLKSRVLFTKSQISTLLALESANEKIQQKILEERAHQTMKKNEAEMRQIERVKKVKDLIREEVNEIDRQVKEMAGNAHEVREARPPKPRQPESKQSVTAAPKKGMQLGKSTRGKPTPGEQKAETQKEREEAARASLEEPEAPAKFNPLNDEVKILLEERLSGAIDSNGNFKRLDLKGALNLLIENEGLDRFVIQTRHFDDTKQLALKLPPNFDKAAWQNGQLLLKPKVAPLPKRAVVETIKYSLATPLTPETAPFKLNFWFSGSQFSCEIDFNSTQTIFRGLANLEIRFKKLAALDFEVAETENSEAITASRYLVWLIPHLSAKSPSASLIVDFEESISEGLVLPAEVEFESDQTVFGMTVEGVSEEGGREVKFSFKRLLGAKDFTIEV
jgi:hypothetical protein